MGKPNFVPMGLPRTLPPPAGLGLGRGREGESVSPNAFSPSPRATWRVRSADVPAFGVLLKRDAFKTSPTQGSSEKTPAPTCIESSGLHGGRQAGVGPFGPPNALRGHPAASFFPIRFFYKRVSIENLLQFRSGEKPPAPACIESSGLYGGRQAGVGPLGAPTALRGHPAASFSPFRSLYKRVSIENLFELERREKNQAPA